MCSLAGAGKTTLVEHILTSQHGYRIAVILNEIGDSHGIEKALLQDEKGLFIMIRVILAIFPVFVSYFIALSIRIDTLCCQNSS
jgi:hypothetical protein